MKTLLAASAAFFALAVSAHAADAIMAPPPAAPAAPAVMSFSWTGGYVGIQGGYVTTEAEAAGDSEDFDGGLIGAHAGYNFQSGAFVFGVEGDVNYTFNENEYAILGADVEAGTEWQASLRARLGYALDRTLIYATGGVAFTDAFVEGTAGGVTVEVDDNFTGYTVGGGVEHAFADNWTGRLEYRYSDFGDGDFDLGLGDVDLTQHQVTAGVSWKF